MNTQHEIIYDSEPGAHVHNGGFLHIEPSTEDSYVPNQRTAAPVIEPIAQDNSAFNEDEAAPFDIVHDQASNSDRTIGNSRPSIGVVNSAKEDRSDSSEKEDRPDGGEKGGEDGPPKPVGFWHKDLSKTRLKVFGLWVGISERYRRLQSKGRLMLALQPSFL